MRYTFSDGKSLEAGSPVEFVHKMRNTSFSPSKDDQDYMDQVSERASKFELDIRSENAQVFLRDLIAHGVVQPELVEEEWN